MAERELDEEMQYHLERDIQERVSGGWTPDQARSAALREMGAIEASKEACRDLHSGRASRFVGGVLQDLRFAVRLFRRHPAPIGIAIGGLALAIGVVTSVFSIVNASMLRPYGMDDPSSVVSVTRPGHPAWVGWPYAQFLQLRDGGTLGRVEASLRDRAYFSVSAPADSAGSKRPISFVSGGYLAMLGARPALGRSLDPSDDTPSAQAVIVVSHHFWKTELNGDPAAVGTTVWVNGTAVSIVGVLQPDFTGPVEERRSLWATLAAFDDLHMGPAFTHASRQSVEVIARLAPGVAMRAAEENLSAIVRRSDPAESGHDANRSVRAVQLHSAASPIAGPAEMDVYFALAAVFVVGGLVLALACANTANLLMAAAVIRMREVGVRLALGATRGRLIRQMISESCLLGLTAGGVGFLLAIWAVPIFRTVVEVSPEIDLAPDARVLLFTIAVALCCGVGAGLSPARFGARGNVLAALRAQSGSGGRARTLSRFRSSFVGFQAAVSMLLLVLAALVVRTALVVTHVDVGFDADRLLAVSLEAPRAEFDEPAYVQAALAAVKGVPGVQRASVTQYQPFGPSMERERFTHGGKGYTLTVNRSDADLFSTAGLRIVHGRAFTSDEVSGEVPVALVSESVARAFFQSSNPVGQSLSYVPSESGGPQDPATIIGVVADAMLTRLDSQRYGAIYRTLSQRRSSIPSLLVRTASPALTARAVEEALRRVDTRVRPTTRVVRERLDAFVDVRRRMGWILGSTASVALLLAGLGVYGVTAFAVGQRTHEVSVRRAMGATSGDVLRLLVKDSLRPVAVGLGAGLFLALAVSRVTAEQVLGGISPHDPVSIGIALATLLICAVLAVTVPARRAARTDPAGLLREG